MLWEIDIHPAGGEMDRAGERVVAAARELGLVNDLQVATARGYLLQGESLQRADVERLANELLVDSIVEQAVVGRVGDACLNEPLDSTNPQSAIRNPQSSSHTITVLLKPGVMDPVAQTVITAANDLGVHPQAIATIRKYWLSGASEAEVKTLGTRLLSNDAIEQVCFGPLALERLEVGRPYKFELRTVAIRDL